MKRNCYAYYNLNLKNNVIELGKHNAVNRQFNSMLQYKY